MIVSIILCVVIGVPMVLLWWRDADKWADAEHKRFKPKPQRKPDNVVVVTLPPRDAAANRADPGPPPGIQPSPPALPEASPPGAGS